MTKVIFYKSNGLFWGFDEIGHTGYANAGEDILCAAISSMTMLVINTAESSYQANATCTIDEDKAHITYLADSILKENTDQTRVYAISGLIRAYFEQLTELQGDYNNFLDITVIEKSCI